MEDRTLALWPVVAAIAGAWILAGAAQATGYAVAVHHDTLLAGGLSAAAIAFFLAVWQVHFAAVMLPSSLPMIARFGQVVAARPRAHLLRGAFLAGYGAVWTCFAVLALAADSFVHRVVDVWPWLEHPDLVLATLLVGAGLFQFSGLKRRCLHVCRRPETFLRLHYHRGSPAALTLGARHGLFCLGCCWALMVVMVAVGVANLMWMAPLALVMVVEKTAKQGERLVVPVGCALIAAAFVSALASMT